MTLYPWVAFRVINYYFISHNTRTRGLQITFREYFLPNYGTDVFFCTLFTPFGGDGWDRVWVICYFRICASDDDDYNLRAKEKKLSTLGKEEEIPDVPIWRRRRVACASFWDSLPTPTPTVIFILMRFPHSTWFWAGCSFVWLLGMCMYVVVE